MKKSVVLTLLFIFAIPVMLGINEVLWPTPKSTVQAAHRIYCDHHDLNPEDYMLVKTWYGWDVQEKEER